MPISRSSPAVRAAVVLGGLCSGLGHAQPLVDPIVLRIDRTFVLEREKSEPVPVFVQGERISGQTGTVTTVEGGAELRKQGSVIKATRIEYDSIEDELRASGSVRVQRAGDLFTGPELRLRLDARTGSFQAAEYTLANDRARGSSSVLEFLGPDRYRARDATYTTCGPGNDDWYLKAAELKLDYGREVGEVDDADLYFKGKRILHLPGMSFSLNNRRKSGFLAPSYASSVQRGQELQLPYYWNIAPNRDMTITPRFMTKRGLQTTAAFRYLGEEYRGEARAEFLGNDEQTRTNRSGFSLLHQQTLAPGLTTFLNLSKVSDDTYFTDLSNRISATSQTFLPRDASLIYGTQWYSLLLRTLSFQTLQDPLRPLVSPYHRLPQINFSTRRFDSGGFDLSLAAEFNRFSHSTLVTGNRLVVNPAISYPILSPGAFLVPKVSWHATTYALQNTAAGAPDTINRSLPIFSVDSGLVFERSGNYFGRSYTQTLEPRLYYLRVPARNQSTIPVFDTGLADFNFAQIFSENAYSGADRIADAHQFTAALSTRLLGTRNGNERLRATIAQRYHLSDQQVSLPGETLRASRSSHLLASFSGEVAPKVTADTTLQYDPNLGQVQRVSHSVRYSPEPGSTVSASYRYRRDFLEQIDVAGQWRFGGNWYGVGRYNYSLREGRVVEALGGAEYDGGCWVGRVVIQRFATASQRATTGIFFQLELNGLSRIGSNPLDVLRRSIPGYSKLNENQEAQGRTFQNYE